MSVNVDSIEFFKDKISANFNQLHQNKVNFRQK